MPLACSACASALETKELIKCSTCASTYHYLCVSMTKDNYAKLSAAYKSSWKCPSCKVASKKGPQNADSTPVKSADPSTTSDSGECKYSQEFQILKKELISSMVKSQEEQRQSLLNLITEKFQTMQGSLDCFSNDLNIVKRDISELKNTLSAKIEELDNRVSDLELRLPQLESIKSDFDELKEKVKSIVESNLKNEQWVRRSNIQINGIPQRKDENLVKVITDLAEKSGYQLDPSKDIDFVTRVAVRNDVDNSNPKPIIIKLLSRYKKDDFLACLRRLKDLRASDIGFPGNQNRVYINDHLSSYNKMLLQKAKLIAKEKNYTYCWVRNCTVMVRQNDTSKILHITSEESLKKIV